MKLEFRCGSIVDFNTSECATCFSLYMCRSREPVHFPMLIVDRFRIVSDKRRSGMSGRRHSEDRSQTKPSDRELAAINCSKHSAFPCKRLSAWIDAALTMGTKLTARVDATTVAGAEIYCHTRQPCGLTGSFCTKRFVRNCLGKEHCYSEKAVHRNDGHALNPGPEMAPGFLCLAHRIARKLDSGTHSSWAGRDRLRA